MSTLLHRALAGERGWWVAFAAGSLAAAAWAGLVLPMPHLPVTAILGAALMGLAILDARFFWLPDALTLPLLALGLAAAWLAAPHELLPHALAAAGGFLALWAMNALYRRLRGVDGLGLGDAKLLAAAGAWTGPLALPGLLLIAAATGLLFALALRLVGRDLGARTPIPFGVFLCLAFWLTWLYGPIEGMV